MVNYAIHLAAGGVQDIQNMAQPSMPGQTPDMSKVFKSESENLELTRHESKIRDAPMRLLEKYGMNHKKNKKE